MGIALAITAAFALLMLFVLQRAEGRAARFVIGAMWLRYTMPVFHDTTFRPVLGDLSLIALVTTGLFVLGCLVIPPRRWMLKALAPIYVFLAVTTLSGVMNAGFSGLFNTLIKWGFCLVILLGVYEAARKQGEGKLAAFLIWALLPPLAYQAASLGLGIAKAGEGDGSASYIGGYNHESAFSIVMVTGVCVAAFASRLNGMVRNALVLAFLVGLYLANYRTTILAVAPITLAYFVVQTMGWFRTRERAAIGAVMLGVGLAGVAGVAFLLRDRFADFAVVMHGAPLFQSPQEFTVEQRGLFSSRLYLWSQYLDAFARADLRHQFFGFGPDSWKDHFQIYAHNTFISSLFELGVLGAGALLYMWGAMAAQTLRVADTLTRTKLMGAHASFILLNMATMGQWMMEGLVLYAFVCGVTLATARATAPARTREIASGAEPWPARRLATARLRGRVEP
ncbi:MAG: O-antigen ligase family protein [Pseudomonadota bacterium]